VDNLKELSRLLHRRFGWVSPRYQDKDLIVLKCRCGFEPHGKASETWEIIWLLQLPYVRGYWRTRDGWMPYDGPAKFSGRTAEQVINAALFMVRDMGDDLQGIEPG
jgi:hypothetical protein